MVVDVFPLMKKEVTCPLGLNFPHGSSLHGDPISWKVLCAFLVSVWTKLTALIPHCSLLAIGSPGTLGLQIYHLMKKMKKKKVDFSHYFPERFGWPCFWEYIHCDSLRAWEPEVQTVVESVTCGLWVSSASASY